MWSRRRGGPFGGPERWRKLECFTPKRTLIACVSEGGHDDGASSKNTMTIANEGAPSDVDTQPQAQTSNPVLIASVDLPPDKGSKIM